MAFQTFENDENKRIAITKIKEGFDSRGFTTVDFVAKLKAEKEEEIADVKKSTDSKIDALLTAKELGLNVKSSDSVVDIKKAIIATKSDMALDGVCDAGIDTAYKMVKSQIAKDSLKQEEIKKSQSSAFDGLKHVANDSKFADLKDKEI